MSEEWKDKIRAGVIMQKLMSHVEGDGEMSATQIKAADILLKKVVPDLARTELANPPGETFKSETSLNTDDRAIIDRYLKGTTK